MTKRTAALRIRLTPAERAAITAAGEAIGLGLCSFARMAAIRAAGLKASPPPRRKPSVHARALAEWTAQLGWIGNNLNQCTRHLNSGVVVDASVLADIRAELEKLRAAVLAFDPEADA